VLVADKGDEDEKEEGFWFIAIRLSFGGCFSIVSLYREG
jgi:hypothetical protein